ncbi:unnamed protein product [Peronospora belbahrii]|uniref:Myb-like domain-containing protein n=1 Tax=Peronospora belbahrii TaxID=622444 RepID=A0ABN8DEC8_9STRA|nr:unnamed protein product [Peronospora belbahrii]
MGRGKKWRHDEDMSLAAAYAGVASEGVKEGPFFWDSVRSRVQSMRSVRALRNRWVLMSHEVKVFVQYLDRIEAQGVSDKMAAVERAMSNFRETQGRGFEFVSCWEIVQKCHEIRRGGGGSGGQAEETEEEEEMEVPQVDTLAVETAENAECEEQHEADVGVPTEKEENAKSATNSSIPNRAESPRVTPASMDDLTFVQQQLASEMRRKNDLQEDELALKLFSEGRESDESQRFFKLLKRKKLLLLEKEVDALELAQHRPRQRRTV